MKKSKQLVKPFKVEDYLETPQDVEAYLNEILADGDPALVASALGDIARSKGMSQISQTTGLNRGNLYQSLSKQGDAKFSTIMKVIKSLGIKLTVSFGEQPHSAAC